MLTEGERSVIFQRYVRSHTPSKLPKKKPLVQLTPHPCSDRPVLGTDLCAVYDLTVPRTLPGAAFSQDPS